MIMGHKRLGRPLTYHGRRKRTSASIPGQKRRIALLPHGIRRTRIVSSINLTARGDLLGPYLGSQSRIPDPIPGDISRLNLGVNLAVLQRPPNAVPGQVRCLKLGTCTLRVRATLSGHMLLRRLKEHAMNRTQNPNLRLRVHVLDLKVIILIPMDTARPFDKNLARQPWFHAQPPTFSSNSMMCSIIHRT